MGGGWEPSFANPSGPGPLDSRTKAAQTERARKTEASNAGVRLVAASWAWATGAGEHRVS